MVDNFNTKRPPKSDPELHRIASTGDATEDFFRDQTGKSAQIRVPLRDPQDLKRVATILRVLASALEVLAKSKERQVEVLFAARLKIKLADAQIRSQKATGTFKEP